MCWITSCSSKANACISLSLSGNTPACHTSRPVTVRLLIDRAVPSFIISSGCKRLCCSNLLIHIEPGLMGFADQRGMLSHYAIMTLNAVILRRTDSLSLSGMLSGRYSFLSCSNLCVDIDEACQCIAC